MNAGIFYEEKSRNKKDGSFEPPFLLCIEFEVSSALT
jgi:hypothetical protein